MHAQQPAAPHAHAEASLPARATLLQLRRTRVVVQHQESSSGSTAPWASNHDLHRHVEQVGVAVSQTELGQEHDHQLAARRRGRQIHGRVLDVGLHVPHVHLHGTLKMRKDRLVNQSKNTLEQK